VDVTVEGDRVFIGSPDVDGTIRPGGLGDLKDWVDPASVDVVEMSNDYLLVEVTEPRSVAMAPQPTTGHAMLWSWDGDNVKARFFAPDMKVPEDAATGGAAIALGALLRSRGRATGELLIRQGDEIGAPSEISLRWRGQQIWVGGHVAHRATRVLEI
jgi:predicted PhzF superfamily epimerase YddE/YHI9